MAGKRFQGSTRQYFFNRPRMALVSFSISSSFFMVFSEYHEAVVFFQFLAHFFGQFRHGGGVGEVFFVILFEDFIVHAISRWGTAGPAQAVARPPAAAPRWAHNAKVKNRVRRFGAITYNDTNAHESTAPFCSIAAVPCLAAEIELRFDALERIISEQVFTQEGRKYVRGTPATKCQFAYLEKPRIGADNGLLRVSARFSGRTRAGFVRRLHRSGRFVRLVDHRNAGGAQWRAGIQGREGFDDQGFFYIRRVRAALTQSFSKDVKIEVKDQARKILEQTREGATV